MPPTVYTMEYGYYITATSGTGNVSIVADPKQSVRVCGIACGGSATNDIVSVYSGNTGTTASTAGTLVYSGIGSTAGALAAINLGATIRVTGLNVTFVGGTSGVCVVYVPSQNA